MSNFPITQDDFLSTSEFVTDITVDVLANDSDPDGDALTLVDATMSSGSGVVSVNANNTLNYSASTFGQDIVSYTVQDTLGNTAQGTLFVDVAFNGRGGGGRAGPGVEFRRWISETAPPPCRTMPPQRPS